MMKVRYFDAYQLVEQDSRNPDSNLSRSDCGNKPGITSPEYPKVNSAPRQGRWDVSAQTDFPPPLQGGIELMVRFPGMLSPAKFRQPSGLKDVRLTSALKSLQP
jgi:hypothetical protein